MNSKEKAKIAPFASISAYKKHWLDYSFEEQKKIDNLEFELEELKKDIEIADEACLKALANFSKIDREFSLFKESVGLLLVGLIKS